MSTRTSIDELYTLLCSLITAATGRQTWRKAYIQTRPVEPYALIQLTQGPSFGQDVLQTEVQDADENGCTIKEFVLGTTHIQCKAEFFKDFQEQPATQAAIIFRNFLQMSARFEDIWALAGLTGAIDFLDVSTIFRQDTEGRAEVTFSMYANLSTFVAQNEIASLKVDLYRDSLDSERVARIPAD